MDRERLYYAFMNLIKNALEAMPQGGTLKIAVAHKQHCAIVTIADTGCGIKDVILPHIFEPFFTTKAVGKGTGLGLATVYGIAKQHLGWVELDSAPGLGTTFRVFLPARLGASRPEAAASPAPEDLGGDETILLVEDNLDMRRTLSGFLARKGYRLLEAGHGPEALDLWAKHGEEIDLVFTDMVMPEGMTGLELVQRLRQSRPGLKAIISSGYSSDLVQQGEARDTTIIYLPKPCPPPALAASIRECLDGPLHRAS